MENSSELPSNDVKIFLETFLKESHGDNCKFDVVPAGITGRHYMGNITRIAVVSSKRDKDKENVPLNIILKSAPQNKIVRALYPVEKLYAREIYLYQYVFPQFMKFQEQSSIKRPFTSIAKCYKTTSEHFNETLILEDMTASGFQIRDHLQPLDYTHVFFIIKEYGRFHALSYAMRDKQPDLFQKLSDNTHDQVYDSLLPTEARIKSLRERSTRALKTLDPTRDKEAYSRFVEFQGRMMDAVKKAVRADPAGQYAVIGHGDGWISNFLFKYDGDAPIEMCFLDWQLSRLGSPALDLSYFLFSCTTDALRNDHFHQLIKEYYTSLCSSLQEFGCDPEKLLPFHVLQEHLKIFSVYGLYMVILTLYLSILEDKTVQSFYKSEKEEELLNMLKSEESSKIEIYDTRIRGVILDFLKYGFEL